MAQVLLSPRAAVTWQTCSHLSLIKFRVFRSVGTFCEMASAGFDLDRGSQVFIDGLKVNSSAAERGSWIGGQGFFFLTVMV